MTGCCCHRRRAPGKPVSRRLWPANALAATNQQVSINSVSCASAGNCSAVGTYTASDGGEGLLLSETAGSWATGVEAVLPASAAIATPGVSLTSVSCASAGNCSAVGNYQEPANDPYSNNLQGLLLTETAGTWGTGVQAVLPANAYGPGPGVLLGEPLGGNDGVSCGSAGNCSAVGTYTASDVGGGGLLLSETAGTWRAGVEAPLPARGGWLRSVSCASTGNCGAVGNHGNNSGGADGLLLTETADKWTAVKATLPANASAPDQFVELLSVSCASAGNCGAVGDYKDSSGNYRGLLFDSSPLRPCVVPRLNGKTLAAARRSIRSHACSVGRIKHARSRTIKKGRVISETPKAGKRLKHGARVNLVVSSGRR